MTLTPFEQETEQILEKVSNWGAYDGDPKRDTMSVETAIEAITTLIEKEVIDLKKEIFLTNDLPSLLESEEYVRIREELRDEQRQALRGIKENKNE